MKKIAIIIILTSMLSGCATIIKGKTQNINIMTSDGENAQATVFSKTGMMDTELPRYVSVHKSSQDVTIRVKEDECHKETIAVAPSKIEPWFWGNIISGGVFGSSTDYSTGAMWSYDTNVIVNPQKKARCKR